MMGMGDGMGVWVFVKRDEERVRFVSAAPVREGESEIFWEGCVLPCGMRRPCVCRMEDRRFHG